jgi:hypothetical protein
MWNMMNDTMMNGGTGIIAALVVVVLVLGAATDPFGKG